MQCDCGEFLYEFLEQDWAICAAERAREAGGLADDVWIHRLIDAVITSSSIMLQLSFRRVDVQRSPGSAGRKRYS